ncbi:transcription factor TBF1-like [Quillaja saponaria]|uniref:Transcription factor TBF1-like n=1 Tax=Quillaja saponaria TaxID=32244 RepID=A0AAD7PSN3_QUISA|nr:transcription factor TBF1-like [Quillaja saponaria]
MGKKPQKTKELSVAIAEASSTAGAETQQQQQSQQTMSQTPRKRGRPRKILDKTETEDKKTEVLQSEQPETAIAEEGNRESSLKKAKISEGAEEQKQEQLQKEIKGDGSSGSSLGLPTKKEEGVSEREPPRSRARRKSKPRKSS